MANIPKSVAFYAGLIYGEYDVAWPSTSEFPDGLFLRSYWANDETYWYIKQYGAMNPIGQRDVPKNILALCLLLNLI